MNRHGFTLIELLVVVGIIVILAAASFPVANVAIRHAQCAGCASHMRTLGIAFLSYSGEHDGQLPGRVTGAGLDKWPTLLQPYAGDPSTYVDPGDPVATKVPTQNLVSNSANNSSFFFNGFNDLGFYNNPAGQVTIASLDNATKLALLGEKVNGSTQYYMDFDEGNQNDILNKAAYYGGSNYAFADGSVQFIKQAGYDDTMWEVNKGYSIPTVAGH